jgi:hypothetical protein
MDASELFRSIVIGVLIFVVTAGVLRLAGWKKSGKDGSYHPYTADSSDGGGDGGGD